MSVADLSEEQREASRRIAEILHGGTPEQIDALIEIIEAAERFAVEFDAARRRLRDAPPAGTA